MVGIALSEDSRSKLFKHFNYESALRNEDWQWLWLGYNVRVPLVPVRKRSSAKAQGLDSREDAGVQPTCMPS